VNLGSSVVACKEGNCGNIPAEPKSVILVFLNIDGQTDNISGNTTTAAKDRATSQLF
jgi:hypothetical protein